MRSLAEEDMIYAWLFGGRRYDIGTMRDWFKSHIELSSESEFAGVMDEIMEKI
jgi:UTP-glucose-1-phosphate uridylyltransferase